MQGLEKLPIDNTIFYVKIRLNQDRAITSLRSLTHGGSKSLNIGDGAGSTTDGGGGIPGIFFMTKKMPAQQASGRMRTGRTQG